MKRMFNEYKNSKFGLIPKEWDVSKLKDIASKVNEKNKENLVEIVFSNSAVNGVVLQQEFFNKDIANKNNISTYYIVKQNDFIYNPRISVTAPCGPINRNRTNLTGVVSPLYTVFTIDNRKLNLDYIEHFFKSSMWYFYMHQIANYGARADRMNITNYDFFNMPILIPTISEQEKIAEILSTWDLAIEKQEQLIEKKKEFKKGLMQRLLSGEVRFKEFDDKWKIISLGSIFDRVTDKNNVGVTNVLTISAQNGLVNQEEYFNKSVSSKDLSGYYLLKKGDFAYNKSYSNGYPLGAIKRLNDYEDGVVSPLYICFRAKEKISTCFYEQYFESGFLNKEIFKIAQEGARNHGLLNVSVTEFFKDIKIAKPSLEEQNKIAEVLIEADKEIELLEKELEVLKLQKKGLMQRLLTGEVRVKV